MNDLDCSKAESQKKSIMAYTGVTHGDTDDDPIEPPVDLNEQFGDDDPGEIDEILDERVREARANGLSEAGSKRLRESMTNFKSIFGIKLGSKPPANIEPYSVQLKPNAQPIRATHRRLSLIHI